MTRISKMLLDPPRRLIIGFFRLYVFSLRASSVSNFMGRVFCEGMPGCQALLVLPSFRCQVFNHPWIDIREFPDESIRFSDPPPIFRRGTCAQGQEQIRAHPWAFDEITVSVARCRILSGGDIDEPGVLHDGNRL